MKRLRLAIGSVGVLLISFAFSSHFALAALVELYGQSVTVTQQNSALIQRQLDAFMNQQIDLALLILGVSSLITIALALWRAPAATTDWSLRNIGWPLFLVGGSAQLLTVGLYVSNCVRAVPTDQAAMTGLFDVVIQIVTTLVISALLLVELLILLFNLLRADSSGDRPHISSVEALSIRPAIFLFLFGVDLSAAFIPLHMKDLYQPLLGLPEDVVLGLPISAMFFSVSFSIVASGIWLDRRGWHEPFLAGLALTAGAMIYAWLASNAVHFIVAMGIAGLGYGLTLMASQGFVITYTDEKNKARGLAYLFAGIYAGSICGTAAGAMLAEQIGYSLVFMLSAVTLAITFGYTVLAMRDAFKLSGLPSNVRQSKPTESSVTAWHYWQFLRDRQVLGLIFLSSLPSAIAVIGLLNYFGPVYLDRQGFSQSIIGSVLIIYSLCMVYLGPVVSKYIDASENKRLFVFMGCVLGGCAFLSFYFLTGLIATVIAVFLLGLSSCLVLASQTTYALTLDVTKQLGQGRAIGIFRASSRIGQMLGPILFGWLMFSSDINQGLTHFGLAYIATAVLFILFTKERRQFKEEMICESSPART